jgi:lysine 2,3-aminomutase
MEPDQEVKKVKVEAKQEPPERKVPKKEHYNQVEVSKEDRSIGKARSAEVKELDARYFAVKDMIQTGFKLQDEYARGKERVLEILGGSEEDWADYRWHLKNRIREENILSRIIYMTDEEREQIHKAGEQYRWSVSPFFASMMHPEDKDCPIRMQAIPTIKEYLDKSEITDPMIIKYNSPAPLISRLYPDRLIINVTNQCAMFCRHCLRRTDIDTKDFIYPKGMINEALKYVRENEEIRDVLLTGGDALSLSDKQLDYILTKLDEIPHVEIKRFGSRMPCVLPQRITPELCRMLEKHDPLYMNTQFNHPKEVTVEAQKAVDMLTKSGVIVRDQTVLLKGVNNNPHIMKKLMQELLRIKVQPYYIFNCKKVEGIRHFRTTIADGLNIIEHLRGYTSGMAVPTFIITAPDGRGKTPVYPQYLLNPNVDGEPLIRTWGGHILRYPDEHSETEDSLRPKK